MLNNAGRADPYVEAMRQTIQPGDIVLDIGAGPGLFSMLAARMGASKVIAVEPNPSIRLAKRLTEQNGFSDRIVCIEGVSTEIELEKPADVIISDLRGVLPLFSQHLPSIIDARNRLLAPGGRLIPRQDVLVAAPVTHPDEYRRVTQPWRENNHDLDLRAGADFESNRWTKVNLPSSSLLGPGKQWFTLEYETLTSHDAHGHLEWEIERPGRMHGIASWFDAELIPGVGFSNHPDGPPLIYGQAFFPLPAETSVNSGDIVTGEIQAHWIGHEYVWQWKGEIRSAEGAQILKFDQSTFARRLLMKK